MAALPTTVVSTVLQQQLLYNSRVIAYSSSDSSSGSTVSGSCDRKPEHSSSMTAVIADSTLHLGSSAQSSTRGCQCSYYWLISSAVPIQQWLSDAVAALTSALQLDVTAASPQRILVQAPCDVISYHKQLYTVLFTSAVSNAVHARTGGARNMNVHRAQSTQHNCRQPVVYASRTHACHQHQQWLQSVAAVTLIATAAVCHTGMQIKQTCCSCTVESLCSSSSNAAAAVHAFLSSVLLAYTGPLKWCHC
eukprot:4441-Heterococcus_DN1.PRE.1